MTAGNAFAPRESESEPDDPELFSALLTPHRSLNRTGFLVLMSVVSAVSFVGGVASVLMGAWPILGFFGLDALAIYWAFKVNFRRARAYEEISITRVRTAAAPGQPSRPGHGMALQPALGPARPGHA